MGFSEIEKQGACWNSFSIQTTLYRAYSELKFVLKLDHNASCSQIQKRCNISIFEETCLDSFRDIRQFLLQKNVSAEFLENPRLA